MLSDIETFCDLTTINHTTVEALLFKHSFHNGQDRFTNGPVRITFVGDKPTVSVGGQPVEVLSIAELKQLINR